MMIMSSSTSSTLLALLVAAILLFSAEVTAARLEGRVMDAPPPPRLNRANHFIQSPPAYPPAYPPAPSPL